FDIQKNVCPKLLLNYDYLTKSLSECFVISISVDINIVVFQHKLNTCVMVKYPIGRFIGVFTHFYVKESNELNNNRIFFICGEKLNKKYYYYDNINYLKIELYNKLYILRIILII
uniref:Uncharacterized protein n=1 Tax=Strongyloides stercoralis TaxID=6248 RepID=A0AAF5DDS0_STRER